MAAKILEWIIIHWYFIFGVLVLAFGLGQLKAVLVTKKELYKKDGGLIYMPATELNVKFEEMKKACLNNRNTCQSNVCNEISDIKVDIAEMKMGYESSQREIQKTMLKISEHMGKTSEFMEIHKLNMVRAGSG